MEAGEPAGDHDEIVMIDDVITVGSTALGGAHRLAEAFPDARIRVFAAVRALANPGDFSNILAPRVGSIRQYGMGAQINGVRVDRRPPLEALDRWNGLAGRMAA